MAVAIIIIIITMYQMNEGTTLQEQCFDAVGWAAGRAFAIRPVKN